MAELRSTLTGKLPAQLANAVSDAIHAALCAGMAENEAACVVVAVAADYARGAFGDAYLPALASVVTAQSGRRKPAMTEAQEPSNASDA